MSDRCATQKKFNNLFIKYSMELLPQVTKNWHKLPKGDQQSLGNVYELFCGQQFLVELADQAEASLKLWENVLFKGQDIGSLAHGGYSNGESGTLRLIRMVCKAVSQRACEKSRRISFEICMEEKHIFRLPVYQFLGNRFNILFKNAAGVYYLFDHLVDFYDNIELENRLLVAVH